jgi:hypothetical protein
MPHPTVADLLASTTVARGFDVAALHDTSTDTCAALCGACRGTIMLHRLDAFDADPPYREFNDRFMGDVARGPWPIGARCPLCRQWNRVDVQILLPYPTG